jgi:hypothetical protein
MNYSIKEIKLAYEMVSEDLFSRLVKAKDGETVRIGVQGALGSLKKNERQRISYLKGNKSYGKTYAYYQAKFTPSARLKQA